MRVRDRCFELDDFGIVRSALDRRGGKSRPIQAEFKSEQQRFFIIFLANLCSRRWLSWRTRRFCLFKQGIKLRLRHLQLLRMRLDPLCEPVVLFWCPATFKLCAILSLAV